MVYQHKFHQMHNISIVSSFILGRSKVIGMNNKEINTNKIHLCIDHHGFLTVTGSGHVQIPSQPVGRVFRDGKLYEPVSSYSNENDTIIHVQYPCGGEVCLSLREETEYTVLTVTDIFPEAQCFVFGPYHTAKKNFGELTGAAWDGDSVICIQSLNPKTLGGFPARFMGSHPWHGRFTLPNTSKSKLTDCAAVPVNDGILLQCYANNMTECMIQPNGNPRHLNVVSGADAQISGASVAFLCAEQSSKGLQEDLLPIIGRLETAEGLPHPTIDGEWTKTSPYNSQSYLMLWQGESPYTYEEMLDLAKEAGMGCLYMNDPFVSWGHFEIADKGFGSGDSALKQLADTAAERGMTIGFHILSNFIHPRDPYVSPIPHEKLLIRSSALLKSDINNVETEISISEECDFGKTSYLNLIRIGLELIRFSAYEIREDGYFLTGCIRGAYGTSAASHKAGDIVDRLADHDYNTVFPDITLQKEMAVRIGNLVKNTGVHRISFDGMEGCFETGYGEYAASEYVRQVYEIVGSELLSDASVPSHYRWHAHSYFNWGEPQYDFQGRGGMFRYRMNNQDYYTRNLFGHMLGQYEYRLAGDKFESTQPENFEFVLSQTVAHNAGFGLWVSDYVMHKHGLTPFFLHQAKIWNSMRFCGDIPDELRSEMMDENANWHLEETKDGWIVSKLRLQQYDFGYYGRFSGNDRFEGLINDLPGDTAPLCIRIRAGQKRQGGELTKIAFHNGWNGGAVLTFSDIHVPAGGYVYYQGGTSIRCYDADYHFLEEYVGTGSEVRAGGVLSGTDVHWDTTPDSAIEPYAVIFQTIKKIMIPCKNSTGTII